MEPKVPDIFLKAHREAKGLTREELSKLSGVSVAHIGRLERGERKPSYEVVVKLRKALGMESVPGLGQSDRHYQELKVRYGLPAKLVEGIKTVETTQKDKPLQVFDNPRPGEDYEVDIVFGEFTSLCPKTGQPDFAVIEVVYVPERVCVELKSLKLYFGSYRNEGHFFEEVTNLILEDLKKVLSPRRISVTAYFGTRGGTDVTVRREWEKEV